MKTKSPKASVRNKAGKSRLASRVAVTGHHVEHSEHHATFEPRVLDAVRQSHRGAPPKTRNISLTAELDTQIELRVRSGLYGNASDVVRAGLRALLREEMAERYQQFKGIMATLPRDPITPGIEQDIESQVKAGRAADARRAAQLARP